MKRLVLTGLILVFLYSTASAATRYVSGIMEVTLRTGQGTSHKIISMVKSGQPLELLEAGEQWSRVKIPGGKEGWILTRFVTAEKPRALQLENLENKYKRLSDQYKSLKETSSRLKEENNRLSVELEERSKKLDEVTGALESLKEKSAEFFTLEANYKKSAAELTQQTQKAEVLQDKLNEKNIKWFLSGAGVLFGGMILGFCAKRKRRSSYYGI